MHDPRPEEAVEVLSQLRSRRATGRAPAKAVTITRIYGGYTYG